MKNHYFLLVLLVMTLAGCASTKPNSQANTSDSQNEVQTQVSNDPFEGFNRAIFGFNTGVDRYILKPIAEGYRFIAPKPVEVGVSNFFANLLEIRNSLNALLQGKPSKAANYTGRFLLNTTVGLAGLIDVASKVGVEKTDGEDFGQTLATWGVKPGPYIVLPLLGPSNLRDGLSFPVNNRTGLLSYVDHVPTRNQLHGLRLVDTRFKLLGTEGLLRGDRYVFIRDAFFQRREFLVKDGKVEDTFGDEELDGDF